MMLSRVVKNSLKCLTAGTTRRDPWLAQNVICQHHNVPLSEFLPLLPAPWSPVNNDIRLIHVVNLYARNDRIDEIQQRTVESMRDAAAGQGVVLVNVQSRRDADLTPVGFVRGKDLVRDVGDIRSFEVPRNLPLLFDVLESANELALPDDYIIYTNADIVVSGQFYRCVRDFVGYGVDALTINRRTIGGIDSFPQGSRLAAAEVGSNHRGFDCLVFRRHLSKRFIPSRACIGMNQVARSLLFNMVAHADLMLMLKNVSLTYHYGEDRAWKTGNFNDYSAFNIEEGLSVLRVLRNDPKAAERLRSFCRKHPELKSAIEVIS